MKMKSVIVSAFLLPVMAITACRKTDDGFRDIKKVPTKDTVKTGPPVSAPADTTVNVYTMANTTYHRKNYTDTIPDYVTENRPPVGGGPFYKYGLPNSQDRVIFNDGKEFLSAGREISSHTDYTSSGHGAYDYFICNADDQIKMINAGNPTTVFLFKYNAADYKQPTVTCSWDNQDKSYDPTEAKKIDGATIRNANKMPAYHTR